MSYPLTVRVVSAGSGWRVTKNGTHVSNHRKKARAEKKAKRIARGHDGYAEVQLQRSDGRWQDTIEYP